VMVALPASLALEIMEAGEPLDALERPVPLENEEFSKGL
jgi:hypothetical protein